MSRENPWSRRVVRVGVVVSALGIAQAVGDVGVRAQAPPQQVTRRATSRSLALVAGQFFSVRLTCVGTFQNSPCKATVNVIDAAGRTVAQFNQKINASRTREFSVSRSQLNIPGRTLLRADALIAFLPRPPLPDPCCCQEPENPAATGIACVSDDETGKEEMCGEMRPIPDPPPGP